LFSLTQLFKLPYLINSTIDSRLPANITNILIEAENNYIFKNTAEIRKASAIEIIKASTTEVIKASTTKVIKAFTTKEGQEGT